MKAKLFFLVLLVFSAVYGLDPRRSILLYHHTVLGEEKGLTTPTITAIAQDNEGYLWLGTEFGLVRFDGVRFTYVDPETTPGVKACIILDIVFSKDGALWAATRGYGVIRRKGKRFEILDRKSAGLCGDEVWALAAGADNSMWIGSRKGLNYYKDGEMKTIALPPGSPTQYVRALLLDQNGRLWAGVRGGGLLVTQRRGDVFETEWRGLMGKKISALMQDSRGVLWIAVSAEGIYRYDGVSFSLLSTDDGLAANNIADIFEDRARNIWIATGGNGLNVIRPETGAIELLDDRHGLRSNMLMAFCEDRENTLWFGSDGGGINCLRDSSIVTYTREAGLCSNIISNVFVDSRGYVWAGANGFGLTRLNPVDNSCRIFTCKDGLTSNVIGAMAEHPVGTLWITYLGGDIDRMNLDTGKIESFGREHGLTDNYFRAVATDRKGNLWVGSDMGDTFRFNGRKFEFMFNAEFRVNYIYFDKSNRIWCATFGGGIRRYTENRRDPEQSEWERNLRNILGISEDSQGRLWICTASDGVVCYDGKQTLHAGKAQGLPDNAIYSFREDYRGDFWFSSNNGIFCVRKDDVEMLLSKKRKFVVPLAFGVGDGMRSHECNGGCQNASALSQDGRLWFPTMKGLSVIDPRNLGQNGQPPQIVIEKIMLNGVPYNVENSINAPSGRYRLEIQFTALSFISPEKIRFKCLLEGVDSGWRFLGSARTAVYEDLDPGNYRFRVTACNSSGVWNRAGLSFSLNIQPRFYQTPIFPFLVGAVFCAFLAVVWLFVRKHITLRFTSKKYKQSPISEEESKKHLQRILYLLEEERIYRDPNISLKAFSGKLLLSPRTISQIINDKLKKNFFELINLYRIKEAQDLMSNDTGRQLSILEISLQVGFNSRSAFNREFKKNTGLSPSQFKKKVKCPTS